MPKGKSTVPGFTTPRCILHWPRQASACATPTMVTDDPQIQAIVIGPRTGLLANVAASLWPKTKGTMQLKLSDFDSCPTADPSSPDDIRRRPGAHTDDKSDGRKHEHYHMSVAVLLPQIVSCRLTARAQR